MRLLRLVWLLELKYKSRHKESAAPDFGIQTLEAGRMQVYPGEHSNIYAVLNGYFRQDTLLFHAGSKEREFADRPRRTLNMQRGGRRTFGKWDRIDQVAEGSQIFANA